MRTVISSRTLGPTPGASGVTGVTPAPPVPFPFSNGNTRRWRNPQVGFRLVPGFPIGSRQSAFCSHVCHCLPTSANSTTHSQRPGPLIPAVPVPNATRPLGRGTFCLVRQGRRSDPDSASAISRKQRLPSVRGGGTHAKRSLHCSSAGHLRIQVSRGVTPTSGVTPRDTCPGPVLISKALRANTRRYERSGRLWW
jgi:hypothetical protein